VLFPAPRGAGNSVVEEPHDQAMWTPELFVEEVGAVREALGLDRVHVLGHSWGGVLGVAHAAAAPDAVGEVGAVREALGLDRVHVLGHSWGGMLGMQYAATQPDGLVSLVVESSPPSVPAWIGELAKLRAELPPKVDATLRKHEEAGTFTDPEYEEAV